MSHGCSCLQSSMWRVGVGSRQKLVQDKLPCKPPNTQPNACPAQVYPVFFRPHPKLHGIVNSSNLETGRLSPPPGSSADKGSEPDPSQTPVQTLTAGSRESPARSIVEWLLGTASRQQRGCNVMWYSTWLLGIGQTFNNVSDIPPVSLDLGGTAAVATEYHRHLFGADLPTLVRSILFECYLAIFLSTSLRRGSCIVPSSQIRTHALTPVRSTSSRR